MNLSKLVAATAVALFALSAQAAAPSAKVATAFGNTVLSIYPDGRSQKIWLKDDGSWTVKGEQVCLKQTKPALPFGHFCQLFPNDPATGIDSKDLTGTRIHLKLVKGHVTKAQG